jgi:hypothetical protein
MFIRDLLNFCIVIKLLKLSCGNVYVSYWGDRMYLMQRRIILRHNWTECSDRSLRCGLILGRIFNCVFKLSLGNILIVGIFNELLELSGWLVSGIDGIHLLYGMPRRIILRHNGSHCCDGELLLGILLYCLCSDVFKLSCRDIRSSFRLA